LRLSAFAVQVLAAIKLGAHPMKPLKLIALCLVLMPALATVQGKTKKPYKLPETISQARYFYVEAVDGDEFNPRLLPEDREAIADVEKALNKWDRYTLTTRRGDADLIFVVRKGRLADANVGVSGSAGPQGGAGTQVGTRPQDCNGPQGGNGPQNVPGRAGCAPGPGIGVAAGGEVGPADDLFEVYVTNTGAANSPNGPRGTLLWMHTLAGGLDSPELLLFKQFKDQVERDYPPQTASQTQKP
jgi:hypothetical protein